MYVETKYTIDNFWVIKADFLSKQQLIMADSRKEAEDIFDYYYENDIDYMDRGRDHIVGSWKASIQEIGDLINNGYFCKME